jgi:photosystem II stability/assembly factor-like uncharacterized protein
MRKAASPEKTRGQRGPGKMLFFIVSIALSLLIASETLHVSAQAPAVRHWEALGKNRVAVWSFSPAYDSDGTIYIATNSTERQSLRGVYKSEDRGDTWNNASEGLNPKKRNYYTALPLSPAFATDKTAWLFGHKTGLSPDEAYGGFWESTDAGSLWNEIDYKGFPYRELTRRFSQDIVGVVISSDIVKDGLMVAAAGGEGVYQSKDKGRNWELLSAVTDVTNIYAPSSFPAESFLALATTGSQVMVSTDGGKTFEMSSNGLPDDMKTVSTVAFSSNFAKDRKMFCLGSRGVFASEDAGATWKSIAAPEGNASFTALAVTGDFVEYGAIAYGTDDNKIYLSDDMGKTFNSIDSETLMNSSVDTLAFPPDYKTSQQLFASSSDGIFRYGPVQNEAAKGAAQTQAAGVEGTRVARATSAAGFKFVSKQSDRVETGCVAYTIAPIAMLLAYGIRKKGRNRD